MKQWDRNSGNTIIMQSFKRDLIRHKNPILWGKEVFLKRIDLQESILLNHTASSPQTTSKADGKTAQCLSSNSRNPRCRSSSLKCNSIRIRIISSRRCPITPFTSATRTQLNTSTNRETRMTPNRESMAITATTTTSTRVKCSPRDTGSWSRITLIPRDRIGIGVIITSKIRDKYEQRNEHLISILKSLGVICNNYYYSISTNINLAR